jgi:hypothetical protein
VTAHGLADLLAPAVAAVPGCEAIEADGVTTWSLAGRPFAALAAGTAEFRLDAVVGAAARRTPDTASSPRGPEWVAFSPPVIDQYAEDRALAWFAAAGRRAGG